MAITATAGTPVKVAGVPQTKIAEPSFFGQYGIYGLIALKALTAGVQSYAGAKTQTADLSARATNYAIQANNYRTQAAIAQMNAKSARNAMYNAYKQGEYKAMQQGLSDAQQISATRARAANRGVKLNDGSTAELELTGRQVAKMNQDAIQQTTSSSANQARQQEMNYNIQSLAYQTNAQVSDIQANLQNQLKDIYSSASSSGSTMGMLGSILGTAGSLFLNYRSNYLDANAIGSGSVFTY